MPVRTFTSPSALMFKCPSLIKSTSPLHRNDVSPPTLMFTSLEVDTSSLPFWNEKLSMFLSSMRRR